MKTKISITLDEELLRELEGLARGKNSSRSQVIEEALRAWRHKRLMEKLAHDYQEYAQESDSSAEIYITAQSEVALSDKYEE